MRPSLLALGLGLILYGAAALSANPAGADALTDAERGAIETLREGPMTKLVLREEPRAKVTDPFQDAYGNSISVADFGGKVVVMNFWATWCPPCRAEMPSIDRLAGMVADEEIAIVTVSMDRGGVPKVEEFFDDINIENLKIYIDRKNVLARKFGALGLPVTVILDREGREIARLTGDAEWDSPSAVAIVRRIAEATERQNAELTLPELASGG